MKCEYCGKEHIGNYATGRFCSAKCARGFSSRDKRKEINRKISKYWKNITKEEFIRVIDKSVTMAQASKKLGMPFSSFKRLAQSFDLYKPNQGWAKGLEFKEQQITKQRFISEILIEVPKIKEKNTFIKEKLYKFGLKKEQCEVCGQLPEWNNKKLVLQLDHKNGNKRDNRLKNLRILCPHCHSQTETFCSKNLKSHSGGIGIHASLKS